MEYDIKLLHITCAGGLVGRDKYKNTAAKGAPPTLQKIKFLGGGGGVRREAISEKFKKTSKDVDNFVAKNFFKNFFV